MSVTRQGYKTAQDVYLLGGEVTIAGANSAGGAINTNITGSEVMQPVDIQSRYQQTIQSHAGVMVAPNVWSSMTGWIDTNGFDSIALTVKNDAATNAKGNIDWSHDAANTHGSDIVIPTSANFTLAGSVPTKARYAKVVIQNQDAAASHTLSAWAYLKA
jgi:hypothetical protein